MLGVFNLPNLGRAKGDEGATVALGDLWPSQTQKQELLAVDG